MLKTISYMEFRTIMLRSVSPFKTATVQFLQEKAQHLLIALTLLLTSTIALAEEPVKNSAWSFVQDTLSQTWQSPNYELYIPVSEWHNRSYYSSEDVNKYNEQPWGLGVGKYRFDEDGDWNALYGMAFLDSNSKVEPIIGYGFQKMWRPTDNFRLGAGYTVGFTLRANSHYLLPIPVILPLLSAQYKQLAVQLTYVPGFHGNGNILFTWLRWQM